MEHHTRQPRHVTHRHANARGLLDLYSSIIVIVVLCVSFLSLGPYIQVTTENRIVASNFYYPLAVAVLPLIVFRLKRFAQYSASAFAIWIGGFGFVNLLHWIFLKQIGAPGDTIAVITRLQYLTLAFTLGFALWETRSLIIARTSVLLAFIASSLQVIDFFEPGSIAPPLATSIVGRASSTFLNPNIASECLFILAILGLGGLRGSLRIWLLVVVFPGILFSFSRAGLLIWAYIIASSIFFRILPKSSYGVLAGIGVLGVVFLSGFLEFLLSFVGEGGIDNIYNRIMFFSSFDASDASSQDRYDVALSAIERFTAHPIFGIGAGYTSDLGLGEVPPHNMYLLVLSEYGLIGFIFIIWQFAVLARGGAYFYELRVGAEYYIFLSVFVFYCLFTHNMFEQLHWLLAMAVVARRRINT